MSKIALSGNASGTGTFTIASPNSNSDRTLNLPDNSGTVITTASEGAVGTANLANGAVTSDKLAAAVIPIGVSQSWQEVTGSRSAGTTYTNSTGRPIMVSVRVSNTGSVSDTTLLVGGIVAWEAYNLPDGPRNPVAIVPNGQTYRLNLGSGGNVTRWFELS
jgi:hypothetical protein